MDSFGFRRPIVIDAGREIIRGHTRFKAAVEPGQKHVPVLAAHDLPPDQIKAYRIADNKAGELAVRAMQDSSVTGESLIGLTHRHARLAPMVRRSHVVPQAAPCGQATCLPMETSIHKKTPRRC